MELTRIPIDDPRWCEFASSHPAAGPFHLPAWATLIADCYRFEPFVLALCDTDGELLAGVPAIAVRFPLSPLRWVSLPFTDSCALLVRPGEAVEDVVAALEEQVRAGGLRELEIRSALPAADDVYPVEVGYQHVVDLPRDPGDLHLHRNFRQHRNQAEREGVQVRRGTAPEDVMTYYQLQILTRQRLGVPVQPRRFFDLLADRMLAQGHGFVATARLNDEAVAACLCLTHNGTIMAKYQASDPRGRDTGASHLVHWDVMSFGCAEGYHSYDLGRTGIDAEGLRVFKKRMSAVERPLVYTHIGRRPADKTHPSVDGLSQKIIRSSPAWVCRAVGEAFYRYTA